MMEHELSALSGRCEIFFGFSQKRKGARIAKKDFGQATSQNFKQSQHLVVAELARH